MKFSETLFAKPSHDALIKLQDHEIKLLEVMKKTIGQRIKYDREYSNNLTQLALMGQKVGQPSYQSQVYDAWKEILYEISQVAQTIKKNCDFLQSQTTEKVNSLLKNKNTVKKSYMESRERMDNNLVKVIHTELDKKQSCYEKLESEVTQAHKAYDSATDKGKLQQIEKSQDRYRKSTMKFQHAHNDYVLQVAQAQTHQDIYRSNMLPELLSGLQDTENQYVISVKEILSEYLNHTSPCNDVYVSSHKGAEDTMRDINEASEYNDFIKCNRTPLEPVAPVNFSPLHGEGGFLGQGQICLNSLSLQGVEHLSHSFHDDIEVIRSQIEEQTMELTTLEKEFEIFKQNQANLSLLSKQHELSSAKLKLAEEQLELRKHENAYGLLRNALDQLGDNVPPPGLDLPELDTISVTSSSSDSIKSPLDVKNIFSFKKIKNKFGLVGAKNSESGPELYDLRKTVREQIWFHGATPRVEACRLLVNEGDFLLRESTNSPGEMVLSAKSGAQVRHFKLQASENGYKFEDKSFTSIVELVQYHHTKKVPLSIKTNCCLVNPICKDKWQLTHDDIEIRDKLGNGNFGDVHRGLLKTTNEWVAVKTCRDNVDSNTRDKFLAEARILKGYDHPNIVRLMGVCTDRQPIYIVMELVTGGDLSQCLKHGEYDQRTLVFMCRDACAGLSYLEDKKCIHRDVAARNCLVTEDSTVKITDFGMSREEEDGVYSVNGNMKSIPMKWTAPESMNYGRFTSMSDVWSFGVLSWEVFSRGAAPYPSMTNQKAREQVEGGYRMKCPRVCPFSYYNEVMLKCWDYEETRRPTFSQNLRSIDQILKTL